jgi:hypothetical protein
MALNLVSREGVERQSFCLARFDTILLFLAEQASYDFGCDPTHVQIVQNDLK